MPKYNFTKRSDGRYQAKVYLGNGEYKYLYDSSPANLQKKINETKSKQRKGIDVTAERDLFSDWGERWFAYKTPDVSVKWATHLRQYYNKLSDIYDVQISKIQQYHLKDILLQLSRDGYARRTIKAVRDVAAGILQLAADERAIEYNVFASVKVPKVPERTTLTCTSSLPAEKRRALTPEEQRWITDTPHRAQTAAMIMMYAGLRRGELIALLWSDINLSDGTISVNKAVEMINGKPRIKQSGKTDSATRIIYIPQTLIDYLKKQPHTSLYVCPSANGNIMTDSAWRRLWDSYLCEINFKYGDFDSLYGVKAPKSKFQPGGVTFVIPRFTAHWLRHTFITLMYHAGVDLMTAKEQAGHSDIKVTAEIYTHLDKVYKKRSMEKLDTYLKQA